MLSTNLCTAICDQLNRELYNSHLYLNMSFDCESVGWFGFQKYFLKQSADERVHAQKMIEYVQDRLDVPAIQAIPAPPAEWESLLSMIQDAAAAESATTAHINNILSIAQHEGDFATHEAFEWFAKEQVEEEKSVNDIFLRLRLTQGNPAAVFEIDEDLGE